MLLSNSLLVSAAEIKDLNCYGLENLPTNMQDSINNSIKKISDSVINLYNILDGKIYFTKKNLVYFDEWNLTYYGINEDVIGLYYEDYEIHIAAREELFDNPNINYSDIIVHEFGHFIYHQVCDLLSGKSKKTL